MICLIRPSKTHSQVINSPTPAGKVHADDAEAFSGSRSSRKPSAPPAVSLDYFFPDMPGSSYFVGFTAESLLLARLLREDVGVRRYYVPSKSRNIFNHVLGVGSIGCNQGEFSRENEVGDCFDVLEDPHGGQPNGIYAPDLPVERRECTLLPTCEPDECERSDCGLNMRGEDLERYIARELKRGNRRSRLDRYGRRRLKTRQPDQAWCSIAELAPARESRGQKDCVKGGGLGTPNIERFVEETSRKPSERWSSTLSAARESGVAA
ncbi:hypothetical protein B0H17DRAFT_1269188 [Mycena rosella]|uniref:Uncharacterized protein n=1 Tax=Mycena rosella TaxID=1033263 RepID=A0AAD7G1M6_MYCRO|nr:hypothetical protein B0H17DRAFT_1270885 [Mycena rosella]KAJ7652582.1 hypothetical protein B0H17DRAFT_1269188 [Mycena rosella]